ncbi:uncharacterized protein [Battus philenor]|uniref:uncharacterized protein n=1 Tax=Battus philenor TaxID=42288 RepID=UPI0035D011E5
MGRQALLVLACCLILKASGNTGKSKAGEASSSRLYRQLPVGVYASAAPHGAYTYHVPTVVSAKDARVIPVNEESIVVQTPNILLKDSYGNKFVETPQTAGFKTTFPQQFVQLQNLPLHLSQPFVPGAPALHFKQGAAHYFAPSQFRVQGLQAASPSPFARYAVSHPILNNANIRNFASPPVLQANFNQHPVAQQQSTSNKAIFTQTQSHEQYNKLRNEPKFQRLQEAPKEDVNPRNVPAEFENKNYNQPQAIHAQKAALQAAPGKVSTYVNGQKTVVSLETKPPLPLLDISLLEPLTFDNPLVPQVQHFLPRINEATYHKLPNYNVQVKNKQQAPRPFNSDIVIGKPKLKNKAPKKKQKSPPSQNDENESDHPTPSITVHGTPNSSPEFSYEINSPNYKETYKEQVVSYNKETKSEPVNYTYNKESQDEPVHYSYKKETNSEPVTYTYEKQVQSNPVQYSNVQHSKAPQQEMMVYYENKGQGPKHLVYTSKTGYKNDGQNHLDEKPQAINSGHTQNYPSDNPSQHAPQKSNNREQEHFADAPPHPQPEHREEVNNHKITQDENIAHHDFPKSFMDLINAQVNSGHFQPITPEYNRNEKSLSTHKPNNHIRVDPNQHIQRTSSERPRNEQNNAYTPNQQIHEKSKHVIIKDETPEGIHLHNEKQNTETVDQEENNEENFEEDYKNAAFGFPAYESNSEEIEKDIYNPAAYGVPREHNQFDIEHAPFQQYYEEGDKFPKQTHSNYKDSRDKVKEDYFLDYSVNKPESMIDRYNNKVEYYKMYKKHQPKEYFGSNHNGDDGNEKQNAKYSALPVYSFNYGLQEKPKQQFASYRASPKILYEYDYTKEAPRDNTAYGTRPLQSYKTKTQFVEPQFQYGFEPSTIPLLLDSELAAMASNVSPENEKPGTRKKQFNENWYIKKTSTAGGKP